MRTCKHCAHNSADHLAFCPACGHWLGAPTSGMSAFGGMGGRMGGNGTDRARGTAAFSRTMVAAPRGAVTGRSTGRPTAPAGGWPATTTERTLADRPKRGLSWAGDAIGYIYVYLRDKVDAGARRRRLAEERTGAEALLSGALNELAAAVLREGVQHPDFTGLLEAIGRAHARREAAAADLEAAETLQQNEATRLGALVEAADGEWTANDRTSRDASRAGERRAGPPHPRDEQQRWRRARRAAGA